MPNTDLGKPIRDFFQQHLLAQRGLSGHMSLGGKGEAQGGGFLRGS